MQNIDGKNLVPILYYIIVWFFYKMQDTGSNATK